MLYNVTLASAVQDELLRVYIRPLSFEPSSHSTGLPLWLIHQESACNAGDPGLSPVLGRYPAEGNGYSLYTPPILPLKVITEHQAELPVSCRTSYQPSISHVVTYLSQCVPPSPSPTTSTSLLSTSASLFRPRK